MTKRKLPGIDIPPSPAERSVAWPAAIDCTPQPIWPSRPSRMPNYKTAMLATLILLAFFLVAAAAGFIGWTAYRQEQIYARVEKLAFVNDEAAGLLGKLGGR